jgi:hypothetical protein
MIHTNRIRKSKKKLQYGGQLYDILPEYKDGFVEYKGPDTGIILNTAIQLQQQYDNILKEKKEALKSIRDAKVHTIYNGLKTQLSEDILNANKNLLERSNNDVLSPIYSQGIMNVVDEKMNSREWTAALGNSPQLEEYETNKQQMLAKGNVQNYDDPNLPVYNEMVKGNNIYNPFVPRGIFETPDYDAAFDAMAKNFPEEELTSFLPVKITDDKGNVTYAPFDVIKMDAKIKSTPGLNERYKTLVDNFYTTAEGASFARKVAQDLGLPPNPDGSVDMNNPTLKDAYNKQVLAMMNRAAIRNQSYKETGTITTLAGQERWSEFQQQAEMKAAETQARLDQDAYFKQQQLDIEREKLEQKEDAANKGSGTNTGTTPKKGKPDEPSYGLLGDMSTGITSTASYSIKEDNDVNYSTYRVGVVKAEEKYKSKLKTYSDDTKANNISISSTEPGLYTTMNYDNNTKSNMYESLVDYYDRYNSLDGLSISFDGDTNDASKKGELERHVKDLLVERKLKESSQETLKNINNSAFEKLKQVKDGTARQLYVPIKGNPNALYDKNTNTIVALSSSGELVVVDINNSKFKGMPVEEIAKNVITSPVPKNINGVSIAGDQDKTTFMVDAKIDFLVKNGYYNTSAAPVIYGMPNAPKTKPYPTEKYNKLSEIQKAEIDRAFLLSDNYKEANKRVTKDFETRYYNTSGLGVDVLRKLNEVSKASATYQITDQTISSIPNELTTKQTSDNDKYFSQMQQVKATMKNSPGNLNLSVYELNTEKKDAGITPTYYDALAAKSKALVGVGEFTASPTIIFDGVTRDDKIGACFYGSIAYDVSHYYTGNTGDVATENKTKLLDKVSGSDNKLRIETGADGKTYLIDNRKFLVRSEVANQALFDKELTESDDSKGVAKQYNLLTQGFSNNELTIFKLDTYSSTNDVHIEKHVDNNYNTNYRVYWKDINGKNEYNEYDNLAEVAKVTYEYNLGLQKLNNTIENSPYFVNQNSDGSAATNAVQNRILLNTYSNLVSPLQYQTYPGKVERDKYLSDASSKLYYKTTATKDVSQVEFAVSNDNKQANYLLLKAISEIANTESIENGVAKKVPAPVKEADIFATGIDSNLFSTFQKSLLKKYFGSEVNVVYKNNTLTISQKQ